MIRDQPTLTYGPWLPTCYLRWNDGTLEQKMRRKVRRDWGSGVNSKSYEYEWQPVSVLR